MSAKRNEAKSPMEIEADALALRRDNRLVDEIIDEAITGFRKLLEEGEVAECYATQDKLAKVYKGSICFTSLPWSDAGFVSKLIQMAFKDLIYRSNSAKKAIGLEEEGGEVTTEMFIKGVNAKSFQGEERPSKADEKEAQAFLDKITAGLVTWEAVEATLPERYGWKLEERSLEGLKTHYFKVRMKIAAEKRKASDPMSLL